MDISDSNAHSLSQTGPSLSSSHNHGSNSNNNKDNGGNPLKKTTITAKDLAFAINISPSMMVESPANVEKLLSILMESESEEEDEEMDMDDEDELSDSMIEL